MSRFPDSNINTDNPDIVLAVLAGETVKRCCTKFCNHWGRYPIGMNGDRTSEWWCECCAKTNQVFYNGVKSTGTFMCDGTRR